MANCPANLWDDYKTRNILSISDRVQVIRMYDSYLTKPTYQSIASKFDCSAKQIKNIIANRESILKQFEEACRTQNGAHLRTDVVQKRQEKIEFLGKVMYEYIQRVMFHGQRIDDDIVRQKALQIKECIAIENFQPNGTWLEDFKMTYGIPAFDRETLRNNIPITGVKRPHLNAIDMIQYVSRLEQEQRLNTKKRKLPMYGSNDSPSNMLEPTIVYEAIDDGCSDDNNDGGDDVQEVQVIAGQEQYQLEIPKNSNPAKRPRPSTNANNTTNSDEPFPDIVSVGVALKHLKALEEYAMLNDNFRAIGLLTQLEEIFKKQGKS
uniref:HTH CENPB-type domain-containing protein n=1 Tax=Musca domestica TaxID=7370 RepID=A0A1I8NEI7_MUSDO